MRHRSLPTTFLLFIALSVLTARCGGGNDNSGFKDCGNGVIDGGEACDDGNLSDSDACLSTCQFNVCGDGYVNTGVEQCEAINLGGATCASLGFGSGSLACSAQCTFDTSGCTGTVPSPSATPAASSTPPGSVTPTDGATPTVEPTLSGGGCQVGEQVVVVASLSGDYGAALIELEYPTSVSLPGTDVSPTVVDRVHFAATGLTSVKDSDHSGDGVDDTLTASLVGLTDNPAGPFVTVTFDCVEGQVPPVSGAFTCTVKSASTGDGVAIADEQCTITVQ
jgi:cysteine-rich repeat protein